jgi:hypothetical protein
MRSRVGWLSKGELVHGAMLRGWFRRTAEDGEVNVPSAGLQSISDGNGQPKLERGSEMSWMTRNDVEGERRCPSWVWSCISRISHLSAMCVIGRELRFMFNSND